ncbi:hypothetical protein V501_01440 [Pseudogymnoascus sp. VKM F-4519 (FW-2642)]|nr:hypothetical protein V501_01440 [Pseudogymnoascus sp. VKM F-4519 (FW-2642)]
MGLIKTAILTGGGIYAIKKVTKSAENRNKAQQPQPDYSRQNPNYLQGYEGFQGSPQNGSSQQGPYYGGNQQQYRGGPSCNHEQHDQSFARGYTSQNTPPAYSQQPQGYNRGPVDNSSGSNQNYKSEKR